MVASTITIVPKYLDCRTRFALSGGASTMESDAEVHDTESRTTSVTERSGRVRRSWQLSWSDVIDDADPQFIVDLFEVCDNSKGFLFVSPLASESEAEDQPLRNTATGLGTGDGTTATFQLQWVKSISYDVGAGTASAEATDVNYPLTGSVVVYANGTPVTVSSVNLLTGVVTLSAAPANGAVMTADYVRAIPVMFVSKTISMSLLEADLKEMRSVQIREIF